MDEEERLNLNGSVECSTGSHSPGVADPSGNAEGGGSGEKISKKAMKRAAKQARDAELRPLKRQAEKIRRRERAHELSEGYAKGTLSDADKEIFEQRKARERERRSAVRQSRLERAFGEEYNAERAPGKGKGKGKVWSGAVVMDLGFDELMTDQEITSMASQINYSYSANRLATTSFSALVHTSASSSSSPRLMAKLDKASRDKWSRCHWYPDDLGILAEDMGRAAEGDGEGLLPAGLKRGHTLVYLSADSEEELSTLREDEVYIIGGLVDRNRYKNLCQDKAERLGIRSARLPIGTYMNNLPTRKVLTCNQVLQILLEYLSRQDWKQAFEAVIPARKFVEKKRKRGKAGEAGGDDAAAGAEESAYDEDVGGGELDTCDVSEEATGLVGHSQAQEGKAGDEEEGALNEA